MLVIVMLYWMSLKPICRFVRLVHRHLKIIDCLTARVFFISTVNGRSKKKKPIMSCASSGHINKLKQSIFAPSISMDSLRYPVNIRFGYEYLAGKHTQAICSKESRRQSLA
jgi:hypothetical protein